MYQIEIKNILSTSLGNSPASQSSQRSYPVQDRRPALHRDTLEHGQHSKTDVIEAGDAEVGTFPLLNARTFATVTHVGTGRSYRVVVRVARRRKFALLHYLTCDLGKTEHRDQ